MYSRLLVPLDGSKTAETVLPVARHLAARLKIPVELLAVVDLAEIAAHLPADKARVFDAVLANEAKNSARYLREIAGTFPGADVKVEVERGRADEVIAVHGAGAGVLTTMATHGRSGLGRVLVGSVTEKVLRATRNPLLVVRAGAESGAAGSATLKSVVFPHLTVLENVRVALQRRRGHSLDFWHSAKALDALNERARELLDSVGLSAYASTVAVELPYGRKRALEIATTLALEPEMMLLDEPT